MEYAATITVNPLTALLMLEDCVTLNSGTAPLSAILVFFFSLFMSGFVYAYVMYSCFQQEMLLYKMEQPAWLVSVSFSLQNLVVFTTLILYGTGDLFKVLCMLLLFKMG